MGRSVLKLGEFPAHWDELVILAGRHSCGQDSRFPRGQRPAGRKALGPPWETQTARDKVVHICFKCKG